MFILASLCEAPTTLDAGSSPVSVIDYVSWEPSFELHTVDVTMLEDLYQAQGSSAKFMVLRLIKDGLEAIWFLSYSRLETVDLPWIQWSSDSTSTLTCSSLMIGLSLLPFVFYGAILLLVLYSMTTGVLISITVINLSLVWLIWWFYSFVMKEVQSFLASWLHNVVGFSLISTLGLFLLFGNLFGMVAFGWALTISFFSIGMVLWILLLAVFSKLFLMAREWFFSVFIPGGTPIVLLVLVIWLEVISYFIRCLAMPLWIFSNSFAGHVLLALGVASFLSIYISPMQGNHFLIWFLEWYDNLRRGVVMVCANVEGFWDIGTVLWDIQTHRPVYSDLALRETAKLMVCYEEWLLEHERARWEALALEYAEAELRGTQDMGAWWYNYTTTSSTTENPRSASLKSTIALAFGFWVFCWTVRVIVICLGLPLAVLALEFMVIIIQTYILNILLLLFIRDVEGYWRDITLLWFIRGSSTWLRKYCLKYA